MVKRQRREVSSYEPEEYAVTTTDAVELMEIPLNYNYERVNAAFRGEVKRRAINIKRNERRSVQTMVAVGQDLIAVQEMIDHGDFGDWITAEFGWEKTTAYSLINLAKRFPGSGLPETLGLTVLYTLTAPKTPESAIIEAKERVEAGENITKAAAQKIARSHREAQKEPRKAQVKEMIPVIWRALRRHAAGLSDEERLQWLMDEPRSTFEGMLLKNTLLPGDVFRQAVDTVAEELRLSIRSQEEWRERTAPPVGDGVDRTLTTFVQPTPPTNGDGGPRHVLAKRLRGVNADLMQLLELAGQFGIGDDVSSCSEMIKRMIEEVEEANG